MFVIIGTDFIHGYMDLNVVFATIVFRSLPLEPFAKPGWFGDLDDDEDVHDQDGSVGENFNEEEFAPEQVEAYIQLVFAHSCWYYCFALQKRKKNLYVYVFNFLWEIQSTL